MNIKIKTESSGMSNDELEFIALMNKHHHEEALKLYYDKINKPLDYLIAEISDKDISVIRNPLFYINVVKLDSKLYEKMFHLFDRSLFNLTMDLSDIKKANPSFFEKNTGFFRIAQPYDSYTSLFYDYNIYLNNPAFIRGFALSKMQENLGSIFSFLQSQNIVFDENSFDAFLHDSMTKEWSVENFEDYFSMIINTIKSDGDKIWYSLYMKLHFIESTHNEKYKESCELLKQKIVSEKINDFNFNKLPKYNKNSFSSVLISEHKYVDLFNFLKNGKIQTIDLGTELLDMASHFTKQTVKKERDKILACINIILEKGCNVQGRFRYRYHTSKQEFSYCLEEITNTRWVSKKLEKKRMEEIRDVFDLHIPHQEARIIKNHLDIKENVKDSAPKKRL